MPIWCLSTEQEEKNMSERSFVCHSYPCELWVASCARRNSFPVTSKEAILICPELKRESLHRGKSTNGQWKKCQGSMHCNCLFKEEKRERQGQSESCHKKGACVEMADRCEWLTIVFACSKEEKRPVRVVPLVRKSERKDGEMAGRRIALGEK